MQISMGSLQQQQSILGRLQVQGEEMPPGSVAILNKSGKSLKCLNKPKCLQFRLQKGQWLKICCNKLLKRKNKGEFFNEKAALNVMVKGTVTQELQLQTIQNGEKQTHDLQQNVALNIDYRNGVKRVKSKKTQTDILHKYIYKRIGLRQTQHKTQQGVVNNNPGIHSRP